MTTHRATAGRRRAFSLLEVILYVALSSLVLTTLLQVTVSVLDAQSRARDAGMVQRTIDDAMSRIVLALRDARGIEGGESLFDVDAGALTLTMSGAVHPTEFTLVDGVILLREGAGEHLALTASGAVVDRMRFTDLTPPDARTVVQVELAAHSRALLPSGDPAERASLRTSVTLHP